MNKSVLSEGRFRRGRTSVVHRLFAMFSDATNRWISIFMFVVSLLHCTNFHKPTTAQQYDVQIIPTFTQYKMYSVLVQNSFCCQVNNDLLHYFFYFHDTDTWSKLCKNPAFVKIYSHRTRSKTDARTEVSTKPFLYLHSFEMLRIVYSIGCPKTLLTNYQYTVVNIPEKQRTHLHWQKPEITLSLNLGTTPKAPFLTIFNLLKPTGHVRHQQFNILQLYVLPTLYLCFVFI